MAIARPWQFGVPRFFAVSKNGSTAVGSADGEALRWTKTGGFEKFGTLPGQNNAVAANVSANGDVIVGISGDPVSDPTDSLFEGQIFRWTSALGMVGVADLPAGHDGWKRPLYVSEDGSTVIAAARRTYLPVPGVNPVYDAYRWKLDTGLIALAQEVPVSGEGIDFLHTSSDGSTIFTGGSTGLQCWTEQAGVQTLPPHTSDQTRRFRSLRPQTDRLFLASASRTLMV